MWFHARTRGSPPAQCCSAIAVFLAVFLAVRISQRDELSRRPAFPFLSFWPSPFCRVSAYARETDARFAIIGLGEGPKKFPRPPKKFPRSTKNSRDRVSLVIFESNRRIELRCIASKCCAVATQANKMRVRGFERRRIAGDRARGPAVGRGRQKSTRARQCDGRKHSRFCNVYEEKMELFGFTAKGMGEHFVAKHSPLSLGRH
jgi:hypothetical protein